MRVEPIKRYPDPGFPTREVVDEQPELLSTLPERWRGKPVVLAALAGTCILLSGCGSKRTHKRVPGAASFVSPIFVHGGGRGEFGCMTINPPVVISEPEARQIVIEEAKRSGISLLPSALTAKGKLGAFVPDGVDSTGKVSFEYLSLYDCQEWKGTGGYTAFSVDAVGAANDLRKHMLKSPSKSHTGIFYDPMTDEDALGIWRFIPNLSYERKQAIEERRARAELRAQVRDFIRWLKAEGVI